MKTSILGTMCLIATLGNITAVHAQAQAPQAPAKTLELIDLPQPISWRPGGARLMYLKDGMNQWYRVDLLEPCMDLFPGKEPKFITLTDPNGGRYSGVVIERRQCSVTKIAKLDGVPPAESYVPPAKPASPQTK